MSFNHGKNLTQIFYAFISLLFVIGIVGCSHSGHSCDQFLGTTEYTPCVAEKGDQEAQFEVGRAAYEDGDIDEAVKWLEQAAKRRDGRTPVFIPKGSSGDVRIEMRETGLSKPGHEGAKRMLERINSERMS